MTTVCLALLCGILLIAVIALSHQKPKSGSTAETSKDGTLQALVASTGQNQTAVRDIVQLQACNRDLNQQMNQLLSSVNRLISDQSQQMVRLNNMTENRHLLQINYGNLQLQKAELLHLLKNLTNEKQLLLAKYENLSKKRSELQANHTVLIDEKSQLQRSHDNLTSLIQTHNQNSKLKTRLAEGWIARKSSVYKFSTDKKNWQSSKRACEGMDAYLVIVNDADEQTFLLPYKRYWIGLHDLQTEGMWKWVDGTVLKDGFWAPGEPNDIRSEDCAEISRDASLAISAWNDAPCNNANLYICEDSI